MAQSPQEQPKSRVVPHSARQTVDDRKRNRDNAVTAVSKKSKKFHNERLSTGPRVQDMRRDRNREELEAYEQDYVDDQLEARKQKTKRKKLAEKQRASVRSMPTSVRSPNPDALIPYLQGDSASVWFKAKAMRRSYLIGSIVMAYYFTYQLNLYFTGLGILIADLNPLFKVTPIGIAKEIAEYLIDFDFAQNLFQALNLLNVASGWLLLCVIYLFYKLSGINALGGKRAGLKLGLLMFAFVGYGATFFQFAPWAIPWIIVVALNPE